MKMNQSFNLSKNDAKTASHFAKMENGIVCRGREM